MTMRVAVAISGRGSNMEALASALAGSDEARVTLVLADRAAPGLAVAASLGIPVHQLADPNDGAAWLTLLDNADIDLIVLAGYLRMVPPSVIAAYRGHVINVHPSLLPKFGGRGMYGERVHAAVLDAGETISGCTVHQVDEVYDRGAVLAQVRVPVLPDDTPASLGARVLVEEHRLLPLMVRAAARAGHVVPLALG